MKKIVLCTLSLHLALVPCLADVIPTRYAEDDAASRKAVQDRLQQIGLSASSADTHVRELTSDEVAYFAHDTGRIQPAGSLYWYEWLFGAVMLGATVGASVLLYIEHSDHHEDHNGPP